MLIGEFGSQKMFLFGIDKSYVDSDHGMMWRVLQIYGERWNNEAQGDAPDIDFLWSSVWETPESRADSDPGLHLQRGAQSTSKVWKPRNEY